MIEKLKKHLANKSILILGFGKEGQSSYRLIRKLFPEKRINIADLNIKNDAAIEISKYDDFTGVVLGENYLNNLNDFELVIKSPGIYLEPSSNISSQTDLFLKLYHKQTIGVTGTKGKSTTSSLIHHILKINGKDSILVGNIGKPAFDFIDQINEETLVVFELSSHQLTDISIAPSTAVFLNLYPEHLDHYPDFESYGNAKANIFRKIKDGTQIYFKDQELLSSYLNQDAKFKSFSSSSDADCFLKNKAIFLNENEQESSIIQISEIKNLIGEHNILNVMAAVLACKQSGLSNAEIKNGILSFKNLEHRLEYVGEFKNIHFYNDSIATIPEACIMALKALPKTDTLLLGGFDRGLDYSSLYDYLNSSPLRNIIFMGPCGKRMMNEFESDKHCLWVAVLAEAFDRIPQITEKGKICLLSPAAASYDKFKNFEQRGELFKKMAGNL